MRSCASNSRSECNRELNRDGRFIITAYIKTSLDKKEENLAERLALESQEEELLRLARDRVELPAGELRLKYQPDADMLLVELTENPAPTNSKDDVERGLIFNYEGQKLVSVKILYGVYAS